MAVTRADARRAAAAPVDDAPAANTPLSDEQATPLHPREEPLDFASPSLVNAAVDTEALSYVDSRVLHERQLHSWDCGLVCVSMVLRALGHRAELSALHALAATRSVWTIDLAVLLRRFGVAVTLVTLTPGVHPGYARHAFYAGQLEEDASRVERLFGQASGLGVRVVTRSLSAPQLRAAALSGRYLVVALVDSHLLRHRRTAENADATPAQLSSSSSYGGHYVVLCGFDAGSYVVQDPASAEGPRRVPEAALDEARRAFGTDEDLLFIACV